MIQKGAARFPLEGWAPAEVAEFVPQPAVGHEEAQTVRNRELACVNLGALFEPAEVCMHMRMRRTHGGKGTVRESKGTA